MFIQPASQACIAHVTCIWTGCCYLPTLCRSLYFGILSMFRKMMSAAAAESRSSSSTSSLPPPPLVHVAFSFDRTQFGRMHDALLRLPACPRLLLPPDLMNMPAAARHGVLARHTGGWANAARADIVS